MASMALATQQQDAGAIERVLVDGDLSPLTPAQRVVYYNRVCESMKLNPLSKPFDYLRLNNKLILYARKDCTEQLRKRDGVSIVRLERDATEGVYVVTAYATDRDGRQDSSVGAVSIEGLKGEARANAMMKAETKAKRRVTLSICGLGFLDETEIDSIPDARPVRVDMETGTIEGEVRATPPIKFARPAPEPPPAQDRGVMANIPTNPQKFMEFVNGKVLVPYDNLPHLLNALQQEADNAKWNWPVMKDADGWQNAYLMAVRHAESKVTPDSSEGEAEREEAF